MCCSRFAACCSATRTHAPLLSDGKDAVGHRVAVCCNMLPCDAVCCSVLQCVAACCIMLQCVAVRHPHALTCLVVGTTPRSSVLQSCAVLCTTLQFVTSQHTHTRSPVWLWGGHRGAEGGTVFVLGRAHVRFASAPRLLCHCT